jgi:hypothetical protein
MVVLRLVGLIGRKLIGGTWAGSMAGSWYIINKNKYMVLLSFSNGLISDNGTERRTSKNDRSRKYFPLDRSS